MLSEIRQRKTNMISLICGIKKSREQKPSSEIRRTGWRWAQAGGGRRTKSVKGVKSTNFQL